MNWSTIEEINEVVAGRTVTSEFLETIERVPDLVALRGKDGDEWREWTYAQYADQVARLAAGLKSLGVERGQRVVLMMRNRPEFHIADVATLFCGATPVSIYNSSSPEQVQYLAGHSEAVVAIVEDAGFLERFRKVQGELPALKAIVAINDADDDVRTWASMLENEPLDLKAAAADVTPDLLATIIYTSGTTGPPKGVMLSHYNIVYTAEQLRRCLELPDYTGKKVVSYLPMAHIAERMTSHYLAIAYGVTVTGCPDPSQIADYAREVKPNIMFGVPRVWEKVYSKVNGFLALDPEKKQKFDDAIAAAKPIVAAKTWGTATDEQIATWDFLDQVAFAQVRQLIGLDELDIAVTGAAPIPAEVLEWFRAIGVPMSEIYGMSESSGPMTFAGLKPKAGTVGPAIPGCEVKLAEDGEIVCRGGNVFQGYLKAPEKTAEALDEDGWLHTGDIGQVDDDGYFKIVDRKKELIITAGGKNISPANLEAALKMIPLVGQACAIGDNRPFVSALLVLDPEAAPLWAQQNGIEFGSLEELAAKPEMIAEIQRGLDEAMAGFNNAERVKKFVLLGEEWMPDSEVLTPTSKLKRRGVMSKYGDLVDSLYG